MDKDIFMKENGKRNVLHHIINVGDGTNFRKSKYPFWGISQDNRDYIMKFMNSGDIIWFCQEESGRYRVIGMSEYTHTYDSKDEPLIQLNIVEREEQNWDDRVINDIQIHYKNLYNTRKQEIFIDKCNQGLTTYSCDFGGDLFEHYEGFKFYASPKEY